MAKSITLASLKAETLESFSMLESFQERIQRSLIACYPKDWGQDFVSWLLGECASSLRRSAVGDKVTIYLKGIGAASITKVAGVSVVTFPTDPVAKRAAYDTMKSTYWMTWKPAQEFTIPELGDETTLKMAKLLAAGAITEDAARLWADQLVDLALSKAGTKQVKSFVEKGIGAGRLARDDAGVVTLVKAA